MQILWMLVETLASLMASVCLLRAYAWSMRIPGHGNPLVHFSQVLSRWLVTPVSRLIKPTSRVDWPSLLSALLLGLLTAWVFSALSRFGFGVALTPVLAVLWVLRWGLYLAMMLIIASAILSLVNPQAPLAWPLQQLTAPLLAPFRRIVPLVGNFDLSPLVAIILIQILLVIFDPTLVLSALGSMLAGGY